MQIWSKLTKIFRAIVSSLGFKSVKSKITMVRNFLRPKTLISLGRSPNIINFYRLYVPNYATVVAPLNDFFKHVFPRKNISLAWPCTTKKPLTMQNWH